MEDRIIVTHVHGISKDTFVNLEQFGLIVDVYEQGAQAKRIDELVVDYLDIITVNLPVEFVRDLIKDTSKKLFNRLGQVLIDLWKRPSGRITATVHPVRGIEEKTYRITARFKQSEGTFAVLELAGDLSEAVVKNTIDNFFSLMQKHMEHTEETHIERTEQLSRAFIDALDKRNFPHAEFYYVELGPVDDTSDLQNVKITATPAGWVIFNRFKGNWNVK